MPWATRAGSADRTADARRCHAAAQPRTGPPVRSCGGRISPGSTASLVLVVVETDPVCILACQPFLLARLLGRASPAVAALGTGGRSQRGPHLVHRQDHRPDDRDQPDLENRTIHAAMVGAPASRARG